MEKKLKELITYTVTDAYLAQIKKDYLALTVQGLDDKDGYAKCHEARIEVKGRRVAVEKRRKELKSDSLEFGRKVDTEARRITVELEEVEDHLREQQDVIDNEKERIKEAEVKALREKLDARFLTMQKYRVLVSESELSVLSDEEFDGMAMDAKEAFENSELKRIADEKRLIELEAEREIQAQKIRDQEAENKRLKDEMIARQQKEIDEKERQIEEERRGRAKLEAKQKEKDRKEAEFQAEVKKIAQDAEDAQKREEQKRQQAAAKKIADKKLFKSIKKRFPTLESAWVEIARLTKEKTQ